MNVFESELAKGVFMIPQCLSCKDIVWPPSVYCNHCLGKVNWKKSEGIGKIVEYSKTDDTFFCLAEFEEKIRIMGKLNVNSGIPEIGKNVKMDSCRVEGNNYNFTMRLI
jgi:uncharacterized protein